MKICAVICEYNPFHSGHLYQISEIKKRYERVVCIMSGNFTQRAEPAVCDKYFRAEQAVKNGADAVIQLPTVYAVSAAQNFAKGAVNVLRNLPIDALCMGMENNNLGLAQDIVNAQLTDTYSEILKDELKNGVSYANACINSVVTLMPHKKNEIITFFSKPNNMLAAEYIKAVKYYNLKWEIFPIQRKSDYNDSSAFNEYASASAIRSGLLDKNVLIKNYVPDYEALVNQSIPDFELFDNLSLFALRTASIDKLGQLADTVEGLEHKLYNNALASTSISECLAKTKSKRYTYARLKRLALENLLDITKNDLTFPDGLNALLLAVSEDFKQELKQFSEKLFVTGKQSLNPDISYFTHIEQRAEKLYSTLLKKPYTGIVKKLVTL